MNIYLYYLTLALGIFWFFKKTKPKKLHHYFIILFVIGMNLNLKPLCLSFEKQWGTLLLLSSVFVILDCFLKQKLKSSWMYAVTPALVGLYLIIGGKF
jgi:hypothetical protein